MRVLATPHSTCEATYQESIRRGKLGDIVRVVEPDHEHRETGEDRKGHINPSRQDPSSDFQS